MFDHTPSPLPAEYLSWLQPTATLIAATLVYFGVRTTLNANRKLKQHEQLEARAKAKQIRLQEEFGNFAAACLDWLSLIQDHHEDRMANPATHYQTLDEFNRRREGFAAIMSAARARIYLIDSHAERWDKLNDLYSLFLYRTNGSFPTLVESQDRLLTFLDEVREAIDAQYREEADRAKQGVYPVRVIREVKAKT